MIILPIAQVVDENPIVKTFYFDYPLRSRPGQFVMLWIPELEQKPLSISFDDEKTFGLTICNRGAFTEKLFAMKCGERLGLDGPYGTSFFIKPNTHYIMVAGGYGAAPLAFLAEQVVRVGSTVDFVIGARTAAHVLFEKRLAESDHITVHIATDDGSRGHKGLATDLLLQLMLKCPSAFVATCGPELMEKKVLDLCNEHNIDCEVSIERYMKCGIGLCGQCAVDDTGIRLCVDGPVVNRKIANQIKEFGLYHRDKSGKKVSFIEPTHFVSS